MKNKFIKSTIILIIGGFITKILGMIIKIVLTRVISTKGIGLYMLILPTFNLFITLCSLGLQPAISKLVSEKKKDSKKIVLSIVPIILIFNILLFLILFIISPFLSQVLLNNNDTYYPLIAIGLTLPFICISTIIKGYFFGKEEMLPTTLSNIFEQIVRLGLTITIIPKFLKISLVSAVTGVVLINIVSELASILLLLLFIPNKTEISKKDFYFDKEIFKDVLDISLPTTGARLICSITYFLEPIILTYVLTKVGYSSNFITYEYGIINGYVFALLLLPSFFTLAISNSLLPVISNSYANKNYTYTKNKIKQAIFFSLLIGIPSTILFLSIPKFLLKIIFNTTLGIKYIMVTAPIFIFFYIQAPLTSSMQAMNKSKEAMMGTLYGSIIRISSLFLFSFMKIGLWSLIIATSLNVIFVTIHHAYYVKKYLKRNL